MLSINTNLSSLITQSNMKQSTKLLNQAVERMTTGFKINHAKDNAANYSISTNMTTIINSYYVATDNVAMGMDLVTVANDTVSLMQNKAERLRTLCAQARNGTYGVQSLEAINSEANAIMAEINRLYSTAEYNGISLFTGGAENTPAVATFAMTRSASTIGFIEDPKNPNGDTYVDTLTSVAEAVSTGSLTDGGEYKVGSIEDLNLLMIYQS